MSKKSFGKVTATVGATVRFDTPQKQQSPQPSPQLKSFKINRLAKKATVGATVGFLNRRQTATVASGSRYRNKASAGGATVEATVLPPTEGRASALLGDHLKRASDW